MTPDDAVPRHPTNPRAELPSALVEARHDHVVLPAGDGVVGVRVEREGHVKRVGRRLLHVRHVDSICESLCSRVPREKFLQWFNST